VDILRERAIVVIAWLSLLLIGWVDYSTGPAMALSLLYVLPVMVLAIGRGWRMSLLAALLASAIELGAEAVLSGPASLATWQTLVHPLVYLTIALAVARLAEQREVVSRLLRELEVEHARVEELSRTDITGLSNSRYFYQRLVPTVQEALARGHTVSLIALDVDNLKQVNDSLGHRQGDYLIQSVADAIRQVVGDRYLSGRLGGDEFAVLVPQASEDEAMALAQDILKAASERRSAELLVAPRVSVGVATTAPGGSDGDELLHRADRAVYIAKAMGGGRVVRA